MIMATRQTTKLLKEIKKEYPNAKILRTALGEMVSNERKRRMVKDKTIYFLKTGL